MTEAGFQQNVMLMGVILIILVGACLCVLVSVKNLLAKMASSPHAPMPSPVAPPSATTAPTDDTAIAIAIAAAVASARQK